MPGTRSLRQRRLFAGLAPLALALGALPLLAPTCGESGEGFKTFARNSIIIPMDVCYQYQTDGTGTAYTPAGGSTVCPNPDPGDVIRAYGLVYQLIRNDIAVYWVIDNAKTQINGVDLTVEYASGFPVLFYDWTPENPPPTSPPTTAHAIDYRGGPFVVDGSDYARASAVLQSFRSTFQNVNVHVSNVAFRAYAKRTMAGGWNAGGSVAPKVALLDIGSTSNPSGGYAKNSEPIIRGYLARAGLDFPGAGGVATDTGHGQIYDRLGMADFQPSTPGGSWTTTNLFKYGYQILWVPHWFAPGSCSNATSQTACAASLYPLAQRDQALKTVGDFVAAGKDLFAECAGVGSFEGVSTSAGAWTAEYSDGDPATHFHATNGLVINKAVGTADYDEASASSPLLQLGDYPFRPRSGAIQNYKPAAPRSSTYQGAPGEVKRLVADVADGTWDYFTYRPPATGRGTTVYLGGHVYSGYSDTLSNGNLVLDNPSFQIGGTRLVLNTLFNLGATCTASGVSCNTGQLGVCAAGTLVCQNGQPICAPSATVGTEICNGLDDDCDGAVDEDLEVECYDLGLGDPTVNVGVCRAGVSSCAALPGGGYAMTACTGQVLPGAEACNALDDDCDGTIDEGLTQPCYEGPSSSIDPATGLPRPVCQAGTQLCSLGAWGACTGQVLPRPEICSESPGSEADDDCDGTSNDGCGCTTGQTRSCYAGPPATIGVGVCAAGAQTCSAGAWGPCVGEVLPSAEVCGNAADENCDTVVAACPGCTSPAAAVGATAACASIPNAQFPSAQRNEGQCQDGTMTCGQDSIWGSCVGETLPSPIEACDAVDNDCDGVVDDGALCPTSFTCLAGVCVPSACGIEIPPPEGYVCNPGGDPDGVVAVGPCGTDLDGCAPGEVCQFGTCAQPCAGDECAAGSICSGGACVAGGCYVTGCPSGELCRDGACVADPCQGVLCPSGTFCRQGDCVQACTFVSCFEGERCGLDGFCEPDACAGHTCAPGERCAGGACTANPCADRGCAEGQVCSVVDGAAVCVDDPCAGITCPAGVCSGGQCYATGNIGGAGAAPPPPEEKGGCGCGSGGAAALPALLALLAAPLARRRRGGPGARLAVLLAAAALLGTACKEEDAFDPASCAETCGEERCVFLASDAAHCGACGDPCSAGEICVDSACGPAAAVAPFVETVDPPFGPPGSLVEIPVTIEGERFATNATVRAVTGMGTRTFTATVQGPQQLTVNLDLSTASAGEWQLRVVNPDKVISNAVTFSVQVPSPTVTAVAPESVTAGQSTPVLLSGTGFTTGSQCRLRSLDGSVAETALVSSVDGAGVHCTVDAASLPPVVYEIWVVNPGNLASNRKQLLVASQTAALTAVSPSSGPELSNATLTVSGSGFDASSRVLFDGCASPSDSGCGGISWIVSTTFVTPTTLVAALQLPDCTEPDASCAHTVAVRNGAGAATSSLPFTVQADAASVGTFATSPAPPYQGDAAVTLTFTGSNLAGSSIHVQPPGGSFGDVPVAPVVPADPTTTVTGTIDLRNKPEGSWLARVSFGIGGTSAAWPFRVLSNQAILQGVTPRSGPQGQSALAISVSGANLRPPYANVRVRFRNEAGTVNQVLDPNPDPTSSAGTLAVPLNLVGLNTGTYALTIENPSAAPSNALSFSVTPGPPTVASVCRLVGTPPACATTDPTSAPQSDTPVPVRITGTNFAKPDALGNGGSTVMVTADFMPGWPNPCPTPPAQPLQFQPVPGTVEVRSPTEIVVQLDTRDAIALPPNGTPYYIAVWNPGGSPPPQKSNGCTAPTSLPSFTVRP